MTRSPTVWAVVVGGGSGQRFGRPKQYEYLGDERVIDRSRRIAASVCDDVVVVVPPADAAAEAGVPGGATRTESVRAGLDAVPSEADIICVHDAARPLATAELYGRVIAAVEAGADAAVPGIPVTDTIKVVDADGVVVATPDRATLVAVQTPQAFRAGVLRAAHAAGGEGTDDAVLVESIGGRVVVVAGEVDNRKITEPADLEWARARALESS
jgi:2-C-methyl-D-erythritol 4-phosphate cytidylyltransferase